MEHHECAKQKYSWTNIKYTIQPLGIVMLSLAAEIPYIIPLATCTYLTSAGEAVGFDVADHNGQILLPGYRR